MVISQILISRNENPIEEWTKKISRTDLYEYRKNHTLRKRFRTIVLCHIYMIYYANVLYAVSNFSVLVQSS